MDNTSRRLIWIVTINEDLRIQVKKFENFSIEKIEPSNRETLKKCF